MRRRLPPFPAVRAFEAAARHLSFRHAAEELHVSQSAVSHQVRHLEDFLGCSLFVRDPRGVTLTAAGVDYQHGLGEVLDGLAACTARVRRGGHAGPLRVCATPAFAARWLAPRVSDFSRRYPGHDLEIGTAIDVPDFATTEVDFMIGFGTGSRPGVCFEPLLWSPRSPLLTPALAVAGQPLREPADLLERVLLRDVQGDQWSQWLEQALGEAVEVPLGPRFEHCELTLRAAESGQGVAMASLALVQRELASGVLIQPFALETAPLLLYSMVYAERSADDIRVRSFREWLLNVVAAEGYVPVGKPPRAVAAS